MILCKGSLSCIGYCASRVEGKLCVVKAGHSPAQSEGSQVPNLQIKMSPASAYACNVGAFMSEVN